MANILLAGRSGKPGATLLTLVDGQTATGYEFDSDPDWGNAVWEKIYSGMRGTQGARLAGSEAQNRQVTVPLLVSGATAAALQAKLSALFTLADEMRRFGGRLTWRPQDGLYRQYFEVMDASARIESYRLFHLKRVWAQVVFEAVCAPVLAGDGMDILDDFSSDLVSGSSGEYTFDAGAVGNVAVVGGELDAVANFATENRAVHTARGYTYSDHQVTVKATPGATITSYKAGVVLKRIDAANYLEVYVDDNGVNSRLRLDKVVAGARTNLSSTNLAARVVNGTALWIRGRIEGHVVFLEHFTSLPTPMGAPTTSASYALTAAETAVFSYVIEGRGGWVWTPQDTAAKLGDFAVAPFNYRNATLPDEFQLRGVIPGDAPALAEAHVTHSGGAVRPVFALIGWWERRDFYNRCWNGDFDYGGYGVGNWSASLVTNITAGATSMTRNATLSKYGTACGEIGCPATIDSGVSLRLFRRFRRGVTYTADVWIQSAAGVTNTYVRLGNGAANDKATSGNTPLSPNWQKLTVTWTPSADRDDAHIAINIAAATATTFRIDGVQVYEGAVAPSSPNQMFGRGGYPPAGIIEGESRDGSGNAVIAASASYRSGNGIEVTGPNPVLQAGWLVDPALVMPDDNAVDQIAIEVWARLKLDSAFTSVNALLYGVVLATTQESLQYALEWGSAGRALVMPTTAPHMRMVRLGTLLLPTGLGRYVIQTTLTAVGTGTLGVDYLVLVPAEQRSLSPSGKANDGSYPRFLPDTTEGTKRVRPDLSATRIEPGSIPIEGISAGLGGSLLELPAANIDAVVKLSSLVPDDPTLDATDEQLAHSATVHFALTPRWNLARSS